MLDGFDVLPRHRGHPGETLEEIQGHPFSRQDAACRSMQLSKDAPRSKLVTIVRMTLETDGAIGNVKDRECNV
jgi:hypothetical protein